MVSKRTKSRRRRLRRGGYSKKEYELIGQSALEDEIDQLEIGLYLIIGLSKNSTFFLINVLFSLLLVNEKNKKKNFI